MGLYLKRFAAYVFQTIEHLPIVIFDVSWNAERVSLNQGDRKESEHPDRVNGPCWGHPSVEERLSWFCMSCNCIPTIYSEHIAWCRPIFQHERHSFHVVRAWRCPITAVSLGISWAAPTATDGLVVEEPVVYPLSSDLNCLECLVWRHLQKELFVYLLLTT
jgi:hypothetical protein